MAYKEPLSLDRQLELYWQQQGYTTADREAAAKINLRTDSETRTNYRQILEQASFTALENPDTTFGNKIFLRHRRAIQHIDAGLDLPKTDTRIV